MSQSGLRNLSAGYCSADMRNSTESTERAEQCALSPPLMILLLFKQELSNLGKNDSRLKETAVKRKSWTPFHRFVHSVGQGHAAVTTPAYQN